MQRVTDNTDMFSSRNNGRQSWMKLDSLSTQWLAQTGISQVAQASVLHLVCSISVSVSGQNAKDKPFWRSKIGLASTQLALANVSVSL